MDDRAKVRAVEIPLNRRQVLTSAGKPFPWHRRRPPNVRERDQLHGAQVYLWVLRSAGGVEEHVYVGETAEFEGRLAEYRSPRKNPEKRIRREMADCERRGGNVELYLLDLDATPFSLNGVRIDKFSLGDRAVRRVLENITMIEQNNAALLNLVGPNANEAEVKKSFDKIVKKRSRDAALKFLNDCLARANPN